MGWVPLRSDLSVWGDFATVWQPVQAGVAILSGVLAVLASWLLTAMLVAFGALVWAPALFAQPWEHMVWAANAINLALIGSAQVVADWVASRQKQAQEHQDPETVVA